MKLNNYICKLCFQWPSLYYKPTFAASRQAVLSQLFLTLGSGVGFNPDGTFGDRRFPRQPRDVVRRIRAGEKVLKVGDIDLEASRLLKRVLWSIVKPGRRCTFISDAEFPSGYYTWLQPLPGRVRNLPVVESHPRAEEHPWRPYPFGFEYLSCRDRATHKFIPRARIQDDWREGLVEIFTQARAWYLSDAWDRCPYYNWAAFRREAEDAFQQKWDKKTSVRQLCQDYEIPYRPYRDHQTMVRDICAHSRAGYVRECDQIIKFYA